MTKRRVFALLLVAAAAAPAQAKQYYFPALPVNVAYSPDASSKFCVSPLLHERLRTDFMTFDAQGGAVAPDLTIRCAPYDADRVRFTVTDAHGASVDDFKAKVVYDKPESFDATAFLVARRVATGKKTLKAALNEYRANVRWVYGKLGTDDFEAGRWESATARLYRALESDAKPDVFYFGLYAAHAKLGHAAQARWYFMTFCRATGKSPKKLNAQQLAFLREMPAHDPAQPLPAPYDLSEWRRLRDARQWSGAIVELKNVIEQAPWTVEAYDALADSYKALGWGPLEDVWRERASVARKVAGDKGLQEDLLDALQGP